MKIHLQGTKANFEYESHRIKVKVTGVKCDPAIPRLK